MDESDARGRQLIRASDAEQATNAMLAEAHLSLASELPAMAQRYVAAFGGIEARCFLADLQQTTLVPFLGQVDAPDAKTVQPLNIEGTIA
ncbi:MAG: hypothetical protein QOC66_1178, partial [Pseudonocardiales bacterium]|nr:hypothetical protein [Pseudonocardiales bacterium]